MKSLILGFSFILALVWSCNNTSNDNNINNKPTTADANFGEDKAKAGEVLFNSLCSFCHGITDADGKTNAPVLNKVKTNWPDKGLLSKYIKNAKENLNTNKYTSELYEQWKKVPQMPPFLSLTDAEVNSLIDYLYSVSK
jgi:mono/diheme cytochrome c family protein